MKKTILSILLGLITLTSIAQSPSFISSLPLATPLTGTEQFLILQDGSIKKTSIHTF